MIHIAQSKKYKQKTEDAKGCNKTVFRYSYVEKRRKSVNYTKYMY